MERKIGEIFEYNGEWYQCVGGTCRNCSCYYDTVCKNITTIGSTNFGNCHCSLRTDHKSVIFRKLEKVGEPYINNDRTYQLYKLPMNIEKLPPHTEGINLVRFDIVEIEIKQNTEDMEEKGQCCDNRFEIIAKAKEALLKETNIARDEQEMAVIDNILFRCWQMGWLDKYDDTKHSDSESIGKNLNPLSLEAAKAGKPVCTRDGRKARIICFDAKGEHPIIALVTDGVQESPYNYTKEGYYHTEGVKTMADLMMLSEKKEEWVNVYKDGLLGTRVHNTKKEAFDNASPKDYVDTVKINWEE